MESNESSPIKRSRKKISKKTLIIILIVCAVISAGVGIFIHFTSRLTNESYENCTLGDVNGDGKVNTSDSIEILKYVDGAKLFENQILCGDVNEDGKLDAEDAQIINNYATGKITSLPYKKGALAEYTPSGKKVTKKTDRTLSTAEIINEWKNDDGTYSYQIKITIQNTSDYDIDGWERTVALNSDVSISEDWDCDCRINDKKLIIEGDCIESGSTATCGVIVTGKSELVISNIETE